MTCRDCKFYAESKPYANRKSGVSVYYSICKYRHRLMTRAYGLKVCKRFESKGEVEK